MTMRPKGIWRQAIERNGLWRVLLYTPIIALYMSVADAAWFLLGFLPWALTIGWMGTEVECYATHHKFRFPGWGK